MAKKKQDSGGARMVKAGKVPVQLGLTQEQVAKLDQARGGVPRTVYITKAFMDVVEADIEAAAAGQRLPNVREAILAMLR